MRYSIASLFAALLLISPAVRADDSWITVVHRTWDTDQILPKVQSGLAGIPSSIKDALSQSGYKIIITPTMLYGKVSDDLERRSSYDVGSSNNIAGQFRASEHAIYIPERASSRNEAPRLQGADLVHVLRHEFGHAYDNYLSHASGSEQFVLAYTQDSGKLTNSQRTEFSYFSMQEPGTSSTELFAELFAIICSPDDSTLRPYDRALYTSFPDCVAVLLSLNSSLRPHTFASGSR